jgi:hypothetical protein
MNVNVCVLKSATAPPPYGHCIYRVSDGVWRARFEKRVRVFYTDVIAANHVWGTHNLKLFIPPALGYTADGCDPL